MRFDAYAGNVRGGTSASEVAEVLALSTSASVTRGRPRGRYHDVFEVKDAGDLVGWVAHDGVLDTAYFEVKGERTPEAANCIRRHWADRHAVSRADSCEDYDDPGAYQVLRALVDEEKDPRVLSMAITPRDGDRGETTTWGKRGGIAFLRLYEAGKMKDRLHYGRPDWKRLEGEFRPSRAVSKVAAASMSPLEIWGLSRWTQKVAERVAQVEVPRFAMEHVPPTFERTTLYLARAFRRHFEAMQADFGDWTCIGREIEAVWAADDEAKLQGGTTQF